MKGIIIYAGKYGATDQYAQWLAEALKLPRLRAENATAAILSSYDVVILGSSVYIGKLYLRKWLILHLSDLADKKVFLFIVCGSTDENQAEQRKLIETNLTPSFQRSAQVFFLPGRCVIDKLSWLDRIGLKLGAMMAKDPKQKANMNSGFDRMDRTALDQVIKAIEQHQQTGSLTAGKENRLNVLN